MSKTHLENRKEYTEVMRQIEVLLQKTTEIGGFNKLSSDDKIRLKNLSQLAEKYEDGIALMPI